MADVERFRDSTQIRLPAGALDGIREELEARFTVTVRREDDHVRIIGSPVEIKAAGEFLAMNGVTFA
ncbi:MULTISPECIES: hypothetical protein [Haloarcula]|uniref:VNG_1110C family protein n=1 Tax=Haloarcula TaxID=2237 RepID=UPI0023EA9D5E|nr:hypothetical protein [Halomicroarcula sp. XH51]